jgi:hypothetical protein
MRMVEDRMMRYWMIRRGMDEEDWEDCLVQSELSVRPEKEKNSLLETIRTFFISPWISSSPTSAQKWYSVFPIQAWNELFGRFSVGAEKGIVKIEHGVERLRERGARLSLGLPSRLEEVRK